ncbi:MAG: CoA transferase [Pseudomonadota bacterium]
MTDTALAGIRVLDLGQIYNGSYATMMMAMAGADVIKVESLKGEALRGRGPNSASSFAFNFLNQNKRSATINLKDTRGLDLFKKLVAEADVVLENYAPDTMINLGLDYETLREINPRLIYAAGSGYGRGGQYRDYLAMDITIQAMSGVISATGPDGGDPLKTPAALCDFSGGIHLYGAVMTALFQRERTGEGQFVDVAMLDTVIPTLSTVMGAYYFGDKTVPSRHGSKHPALSMAPYNVYQASDGYVAIICINEKHWLSMAKAMNREDLLDDPRYGSMRERAAIMAEVDEQVTAWTSPRTRAEVLASLQGAGVPSASVRDVEEVLADEHLHERGMLHEIDHPVWGEMTLMNSPLNVALGNNVAPVPAPELGGANDDVYGGLLGIAAPELATLKSEGVI